MTLFRVWAPLARKVEVEVGGSRVPMTPLYSRLIKGPPLLPPYQEGTQGGGYGGWWAVKVPWASPNADYTFVLDGGEPLPDPRSPWQPYGVHGPSRLIDQSAFSWTDAGWQGPPLASAVIYELHIGTFTPEGTFEAAIERLDHLVDLGITHVELMPINEFVGARGWGYDGVDLYAPHHSYDGPTGLKGLVDACHSRGLAVLLDVVYNHLGPEGNYLSRFGPYFSNRYPTPWGQAVNLDGAGSDEVRRFFCDNALMWLRDYHFDGLRIDAIHAIFDSSAIHFLEQLASEVEALEAQLGRHLVLIAESALNDPRVVQPRGMGGYGLDAQWNDDFHHALHAVLTGQQDGYYADFGSWSDLAKAIQHAFVYDGRYSTFRRRRHGRPAAGLSGHRFVVCFQDHDQVGNRARGERSSHLLSVGRLKVAAALVLTSPFIPMLFQGEEWGASSPFQFFIDYQDPELGRGAREGRRREFATFGWDPQQIPDPQAQETFERSKLNWSEIRREPHASLLDWHRRLIRLRREEPALRSGNMALTQVRFDEKARCLAVERGPVTVICNLADQMQRVPIGHEHPVKVLLASETPLFPPLVKGVDAGAVQLPPDSVAILAAEVSN